MSKCPKCSSPKPKLHPAVQFEGEVQPCQHAFHDQPGDRFVIKHDNGTYFVQYTAIGPMFGGEREEAKVFDSREDACRPLMDWRFGDSTVERLIA
jgi:hypothetical protein